MLEKIISGGQTGAAALMLVDQGIFEAVSPLSLGGRRLGRRLRGFLGSGLGDLRLGMRPDVGLAQQRQRLLQQQLPLSPTGLHFADRSE